ncbi:MAG TPA: cytochrome c biogenesis heme-transporting ATPase CcmA [Woeseiaceae bacterium]|nr:cytochrome c biogenesis heme-transporting ATPase CcmA [Woeseiaceae bacterium]
MAELSGQDLTLIRGNRCLFQGLDFTVGSGELLMVEGPNGSGKTSLLRAIAGLIDPDEGVVRWDNTNVKKNRQSFHALLVWMGHRPGFAGDLTLIENLRFEAGLRSMTMSTAEHQLRRLKISKLVDIPFRALSAGQQRRVALARMCLADAPLWLMDEPFTNMDAEGQALVVDVLREHLQDGGLCVMATHQRFELDATIRRIKLT